MNKIVLVLGSPRSGTTFLAREICRRVKTPLLPEAQWIIEIIDNRQFGCYTLTHWKNSRLASSCDDLKANKIFELFQSECDLREILKGDTIVEHTPQNILYLDKIIKLLDGNEVTLVAPLRDPEHSIMSLARQSWFKKNIFAAAYFNLKCLSALFKHRKQINFIKLTDKDIDFQLDKLFGIRNEEFMLYNAIETAPDLLESHQYFIGDRPHIKKSLLTKILSLPSKIFYVLLTK